MDSNLETDPGARRDGCVRVPRRSGRALIAVIVLAACGIETEPRPGNQDASVIGGAGSGGRGDGGAGRGDAGEPPQAGSGGAGTSGGGAGSVAGADGGGAGGGGAECDEARSPRDEPCLVADDRAVFVSMRGDDDDAGTMARPMRTVSAAVAKAVEGGSARVIVCGGTYQEALAIDAAVSVHGGFACDQMPWQPTQAATLVQPDQTGYALRIEDVAGRVLLQDLQFSARDATSAGVSSVAAVVKDSADVVLRGVTLQAGAGGPGAAGVTHGFAFPRTGAPGDTCADPMTMCLAGKSADGNSGGADRAHTCPGGDTTTGGLGGAASAGGAQPGDPGLPDYGTGEGEGGPGGASCGSGEDGAAGGAGTHGTGAAAAGALDAQGWTPAAGRDGMPGRVGQGGGGGGAKEGTGGGGGGGAGGCGGAGGAAGQGGGGSIALLSVSSGVTLEGCTLRTGAGGDGGRGAAGQDGMASGGTAGNGTSGACPGGAGGGGGKGGAGGGGAGGISAGVVWAGSEPALDDAEFVLGTPGNGGAGGDDAGSADDGTDGISVQVLQGG